jgi:hypothetical protein
MLFRRLRMAAQRRHQYQARACQFQHILQFKLLLI